jgi:TolB protein
MYKNLSYGIELMYPTRWAMVNNLHYEGVDGFFRISTLQSDSSLEDICKREAYHKLKPYGSNPRITHTSASSLTACMVLPSIDQPMEMKKQTALVIEYPNPIMIDNKTFSHLILWTDHEHIGDIRNSINITV